MSDETNPAGTKVPDTATTYERAKPEEESPSKALAQPKAPPPQQADQLNQWQEPKAKNPPAKI